MAIDTLHPQSARAMSGIDPKLFIAAAEMMGLAPDHPRVIERVEREELESKALRYATSAVRAAMDALGALDMLHAADVMDHLIPNEHMSADQRDAAITLLRLSRRNLRAAVGGAEQPGYDQFLDMISQYGLDVFDD